MLKVGLSVANWCREPGGIHPTICQTIEIGNLTESNLDPSYMQMCHRPGQSGFPRGNRKMHIWRSSQPDKEPPVLQLYFMSYVPSSALSRVFETMSHPPNIQKRKRRGKRETTISTVIASNCANQERSAKLCSRYYIRYKGWVWSSPHYSYFRWSPNRIMTLACQQYIPRREHIPQLQASID